MQPIRSHLPHDVPGWVDSGAVFHITVNTVPRQLNQLCRGNLASALWDTIQFRESRGEWFIHLLVLMPDHLHGLFSFAKLPGMRKSMRDWKSFTAKALDIQWQRDFFDHRLRSDESYAEQAHYIRMNPVRRGLATRPEDWPHCWQRSADGELRRNATRRHTHPTEW